MDGLNFNISDKDLALLSGSFEFPDDFGNGEYNDVVEIHVYDVVNNYIQSQHNVPKIGSNDIYFWDINSSTEENIFEASSSTIVSHSLGIVRGKYNLTYNLFRNILGSYEGNRVYINEISPSRKEIRVRPTSVETDEQGLLITTEEWDNFNSISSDNRVGQYVVNFGYDRLYLITNWVFESDIFNDCLGSYVIKLYSPLEDNITVHDQLWVSKIICNPIHGTVNLYKELSEPSISPLSPNSDLTSVWYYNSAYGMDNPNNVTIDNATYNSLIGSDNNISSSILSQIISHLSGSLIEGAKLNTDYTDYSNFIHFGSAEERLVTFRHKLEQIKEYESKSAEWNLEGDIGTFASESLEFLIQKNKIIQQFDGYERYLYFESASYIPEESASGYGTIYNTTWPKTNNEWPYELFCWDSSEGEAWYNTQIVTASDFDRENPHSLIKTIPYHIREDSYNIEYLTFINMIGHFFDIIWEYINHFTDVYKRENDLSIAASKDVLYDVAQSFGMLPDFTAEWNSANLWEWWSGYQSDSDTYISSSEENINYELWNRLLNTLPYILKTKGTQACVDAICNCYGITPSDTSLRLTGYTGRNTTGSEEYLGVPTAKWEARNFALDFIEGNDSYLSTDWGIINPIPKSLEIRFKTEPSYTSSEMILVAIDEPAQNWITIEHSGSNKGWVHLRSDDDAEDRISSSVLPIYNGEFWNISVVSASDNFYLYVAEQKNGNIIYEDVISGTINDDYWQSTGNIWINDSSNNYSFTGSVQEFRLWNYELSQDDFRNHVKDIRNISLNNGSINPYEYLLTRYSFNYPINHNDTASINDEILNTSYNTTASVINFPDESTWPYNYSYYYQWHQAAFPSIGSEVSIKLNNIKSTTSELFKPLSPTISSVRRSTIFTEERKGSKEINFGLNIHDNTNTEIAQIFNKKYFDDLLDTIVGTNPYKLLNDLSKTYSTNYQYHGFPCINDTLKQLVNLPLDNIFGIARQIVPADTSFTTGITISGHALERSRVNTIIPVSLDELHYNGTVNTSKHIDIVSTNKIWYNTDIKQIDEIELSSNKINYVTELDNYIPYDITSNHLIYNSIVDSLIPTNINGSKICYLSNIQIKENYINFISEYKTYIGTVDTNIPQDIDTFKLDYLSEITNQIPQDIEVFKINYLSNIDNQIPQDIETFKLDYLSEISNQIPQDIDIFKLDYLSEISNQIPRDIETFKINYISDVDNQIPQNIETFKINYISDIDNQIPQDIETFKINYISDVDNQIPHEIIGDHLLYEDHIPVVWTNVGGEYSYNWGNILNLNRVFNIGIRYAWNNLILSGSEYIEVPNPDKERNALQTIILPRCEWYQYCTSQYSSSFKSVPPEFTSSDTPYAWYSSSTYNYETWTYQKNHYKYVRDNSKQWNNSRFNGVKQLSPEDVRAYDIYGTDRYGNFIYKYGTAPLNLSEEINPYLTFNELVDNKLAFGYSDIIKNTSKIIVGPKKLIAV